MKSLPPFNWFRAFECAARHLSFTAAAQELHLTQSAISQHVRALESRMGKVLFIRKARGLALTDSGRLLLPHVTGAIAGLAAGTSIFEPQSSTNVLRVACSIAFSMFWLAPRLSRFLSAHPDLDIRVITALWPDDYLLSEADVEIRFGAKELVGAGAEVLLQDTIVPLCAPALLKGLEREIISWSDLRDIPLVHTMGTSDTWQSWADDLGLAPPSPVSRSVDSWALGLEFARKGIGMVLATRLLAAPMISTGELVIPLNLSTLAKDNHFVALRKPSSGEHTAQAFRDWLFTEIADDRP